MFFLVQLSLVKAMFEICAIVKTPFFSRVVWLVTKPFARVLEGLPPQTRPLASRQVVLSGTETALRERTGGLVQARCDVTTRGSQARSFCWFDDFCLKRMGRLGVLLFLFGFLRWRLKVC